MLELVSIITPLYNSQNYIADTIKSVIAQTYQNWEMIIVDDRSDDAGPDIITKLSKKDSRIKLIMQNKHLGPSDTRNRGIKLAKGRYLAFLDSDDMWHKEKLESQLKFMHKNQYAFTFTAYEKIDETGEPLGIIIPYKKQVSYHDLLKSNHIGCLTAILDLTIIGKKIYMPDIKKRQDHGLWLEVLKFIDKAYCLNKVLGQYRIIKGSISRNKIGNIRYQWQLYRKIEKLNIFHSIYYMLFYAFYGFQKYSN